MSAKLIPGSYNPHTLARVAQRQESPELTERPSWGALAQDRYGRSLDADAVTVDHVQPDLKPRTSKLSDMTDVSALRGMFAA